MQLRLTLHPVRRLRPAPIGRGPDRQGVLVGEEQEEGINVCIFLNGVFGTLRSTEYVSTLYTLFLLMSRL